MRKLEAKAGGEALVVEEGQFCYIELSLGAGRLRHSSQRPRRLDSSTTLPLYPRVLCDWDFFSGLVNRRSKYVGMAAETGRTA